MCANKCSNKCSMVFTSFPLSWLDKSELRCRRSSAFISGQRNCLWWWILDFPLIFTYSFFWMKIRFFLLVCALVWSGKAHRFCALRWVLVGWCLCLLGRIVSGTAEIYFRTKKSEILNWACSCLLARRWVEVYYCSSMLSDATAVQINWSWHKRYNE